MECFHTLASQPWHASSGGFDEYTIVTDTMWESIHPELPSESLTQVMDAVVRHDNDNIWVVIVYDANALRLVLQSPVTWTYDDSGVYDAIFKVLGGKDRGPQDDNLVDALCADIQYTSNIVQLGENAYLYKEDDEHYTIAEEPPCTDVVYGAGSPEEAINTITRAIDKLGITSVCVVAPLSRVMAWTYAQTKIPVYTVTDESIPTTYQYYITDGNIKDPVKERNSGCRRISVIYSDSLRSPPTTRSPYHISNIFKHCVRRTDISNIDTDMVRDVLKHMACIEPDLVTDPVKMANLQHQVTCALAGGAPVTIGEESPEQVLCNQECSICLMEEDTPSVTIPTCKHTYHRTCLFEWIQHYDTSCPLCRQSCTWMELSTSATLPSASNQLQDMLLSALNRRFDTTNEPIIIMPSQCMDQLDHDVMIPYHTQSHGPYVSIRLIQDELVDNEPVDVYVIGMDTNDASTHYILKDILQHNNLDVDTQPWSLFTTSIYTDKQFYRMLRKSPHGARRRH